MYANVAKIPATVVRIYLSEAVPLSQPRGEQTKILKFEFAPLASSTLYANTLRPRILALTSFVWSQFRK